MIVGNHCMTFGERGALVMDTMTNAMRKNVKDPTNLLYLVETSRQLKNITNLWYEIMKVMKSVKKQSDERIKQFKINTKKLNQQYRV